MDQEYDYIVLGTGLTECVLSGICSANHEKSVLQMDRNSYYGGDATSLNLIELYKQFGMGEPPSELGPSKNWNVDLIPKFLMADGKLVKLLISTGVTKYLDFKSAEGSYSLRDKKIQKVPSTPQEAFSTSLLGLLEKNRVRKFLTYVHEYDQSNPSTHKGFDSSKTMLEVYNHFNLSCTSRTFIGHSMALHANDSYLDKPCVDTFLKIKLYFESLGRYGKSPYLYPMYGLGELPQAFARRCAVFGGVYMLNKPIEKVEVDGDVVKVTSQNETVRGKQVIGDPSYFPDYVTNDGRVLRVICILNRPIPNTCDNASCQIIIPQAEYNLSHDIYILCVSSTHNICDQGKYVAIVSTTIDDNMSEKEAENIIKPALDLLGPIVQKFVSFYDIKKPKEDRKHKDKIFISRSYDASCHFETTCDDILDLYKQIFKQDFDFNAVSGSLEEE